MRKKPRTVVDVAALKPQQETKVAQRLEDQRFVDTRPKRSKEELEALRARAFGTPAQAATAQAPL